MWTYYGIINAVVQIYRSTGSVVLEVFSSLDTKHLRRGIKLSLVHCLMWQTIFLGLFSRMVLWSAVPSGSESNQTCMGLTLAQIFNQHLPQRMSWMSENLLPFGQWSESPRINFDPSGELRSRLFNEFMMSSVAVAASSVMNVNQIEKKLWKIPGK